MIILIKIPENLSMAAPFPSWDPAIYCGEGECHYSLLPDSGWEWLADSGSH